MEYEKSGFIYTNRVKYIVMRLFVLIKYILLITVDVLACLDGGER